MHGSFPPIDIATIEKPTSSVKTFYHDMGVFEKAVGDDLAVAVNIILSGGVFTKNGLSFSLAKGHSAWEVLVGTIGAKPVQATGERVIETIHALMRPDIVEFDIEETFLDMYFPKLPQSQRIAEDAFGGESRDSYAVDSFKLSGFFTTPRRPGKALVSSDFLRFNMNGISLKEGKYVHIGLGKTVSQSMVQIFEIDM